MNLVLEADTTDELRSLINESVQLLLLDLLEDNELDDFLRKHGWALASEVVRDGDNVRFDVPWELLVSGNTRDTEHQTH